MWSINCHVVCAVALSTAASAIPHGSFKATLTPADPCRDPPGRASIWCDHTADIETRIAGLVGNLTNDEKAGLFINGASPVERIHWPGYNWLWIHISIPISMHISRHMPIHMCMHMCMHMCIHMCIHMSMHTWLQRL